MISTKEAARGDVVVINRAHPASPGNPVRIVHCQSLEWGIAYFITAWGLGIRVPLGDPRAFDTPYRHVFSEVPWMIWHEFIGKDEAFVEQWLVCHGQDKFVDV